MIIRNTDRGDISADISLSDAPHLLRALDRQAKADAQAHPRDAQRCRQMANELARAISAIKLRERNTPTLDERLEGWKLEEQQ